MGKIWTSFWEKFENSPPPPPLPHPLFLKGGNYDDTGAIFSYRKALIELQK